jgi:hypothetical protein
MILDTIYHLEVRLQQINEKIAHPTTENTNMSAISDLENERAVTKQCLLICEGAKSYYIESLTNLESTPLQDAPKNATDDEDDIQNCFEAQPLTHQTLGENRDSLVELIVRIQGRLESLILDKDPRNDTEILRLQEYTTMAKQCIETCKVSLEVSCDSPSVYTRNWPLNGSSVLNRPN